MNLKLPVAMCAMTVASVWGQTASATRLEFEVTSIKLVKAEPDAPHPVSCSPGGRFVASNIPAEYLIGWAYLIKDPFTVPPWASFDSGEKYNIEAKADGPTSLADCRIMVQHMLEDRFQLKLHTQTREANVYLLTVAKGGSKLREVDTSAPPKESDGVFLQGQKLTAKGWEAWKIGSYLGGLPGIERPVVDKTGLQGLYGFSLDFHRGEDANMFTKIEEQLGLKLEPGKAPVDFVVIDRLTRPSEN